MVSESFDLMGIPYRGFLTPREQVGQYANMMFRPGPSQMRSAFFQASNPLLAQYQLSAPLTLQEYDGGEISGFGSFADFANRFGQGDQIGVEYDPYSGETLRQRAQQAALMGRTPAGQFMQYLDPQDDYVGPPLDENFIRQMEGMTPEQQVLYSQMYGTGDEAAQNQAALVDLMALSRPGGGFYGGVYGQAIQSLLNNMRQQVITNQPETNFLDWYLSRTTGESPGMQELLARS